MSAINSLPTTAIHAFSIRRVYTRDVKIPEFDQRRRECGWISLAVPPGATGHWEIFDFSPERKTGWRRVSITTKGARS
jgi:hypothetical protein